MSGSSVRRVGAEFGKSYPGYRNVTGFRSGGKFTPPGKRGGVNPKTGPVYGGGDPKRG
jgi:hypothetical protein